MPVLNAALGGDTQLLGYSTGMVAAALLDFSWLRYLTA
jgi:hypothetical protein